MNNFELPANFLSFFDNGNIKITCDKLPSVNFSIKENNRIIDILDIPIKLSYKFGWIKQLSEAKQFARSLKNQNITLEIKLKGDTVMKLGKDANPKIAKIVTLSNDIEITDLKKLKKLNNIF